MTSKSQAQAIAAMIAQQVEEYRHRVEEEKIPDELNFLSSEFDAEKALATPGLAVPVPKVKTLDNLSRCVPLIPGLEKKEIKQVDPEVKIAKEEQRQRILAKKQAPPKIRNCVFAAENHMRKVVARMLDSWIDEPYNMLSRAFSQNRRIEVRTRGASGVRGVCFGLLKAFDKHLNMVLLDATEEYVVAVREDCAFIDSLVATQATCPHLTPLLGPPPKARIWIKKERYAAQTLLRGDNVVLVKFEQSAGSTAAAASIATNSTMTNRQRKREKKQFRQAKELQPVNKAG